MQQKMFKVMWAAMVLGLATLHASPALAQDSGMGDTQVVSTTTDLGIADFDGEVIDCDTRSDCEKAEQAVADAQSALDAAKVLHDNLDKDAKAAANETTKLFACTPPPSAAEIAAANERLMSTARATQDAATVVTVNELALNSAKTVKEAACANKGFQLLPNWEIDPDVIDRNPTIPIMPSPDFQVDAEFGQFDAQGSSANSS